MRTFAHLVRPGLSSTHDKVGTVGVVTRRRWTYWEVYASIEAEECFPNFTALKSRPFAFKTFPTAAISNFGSVTAKRLLSPFHSPCQIQTYFT